MKGWISIHRSIKNHWLYPKSRAFTKYEAWITVLLEVNHADIKEAKGFNIIECKRGESTKSLDTWARMFNWNKSKVRRFFIMLQNDNMIETKSVHKTTHLKVCNYDSYQNDRNISETKVKRKRNDSETELTPNNNVNKENNVNNDNKSNPLSFTYEKFIILFNEITGRTFRGDSKSKGHFNQRIKNYNAAEFGIAIRNAHKDDYLRQNPKYLTPEYISRENQIEKWLNAVNGEKQPEKINTHYVDYDKEATPQDYQDDLKNWK